MIAIVEGSVVPPGSGLAIQGRLWHGVKMPDAALPGFLVPISLQDTFPGPHARAAVKCYLLGTCCGCLGLGCGACEGEYRGE